MLRLAPFLTIALVASAVLAGCTDAQNAALKEQSAQKLGGKGIAGTTVFPGEYKFDGRYSHILADPIFDSLPPVRQYLESKLDGAAIEIGYWLPSVPEGTKVPVIVDASPYHRVGSNVVTLGGMKLFLQDNFVPQGYAVAAVSVRGTGNSGGCMDLMGADETADLDQAITWLGEQPWSNGNVAMIGVSYDGSTPWSVASTGNPHLKSIVPISGLPDIYGLMYRNGSSEQRGAFLVNALYYTYGPSAEDAQQDADQQRGNEQRVQGTACADYAVGLEGAGWATVVGSRDPTGYWAERNRKPAIEQNYRGSILHVQGLQDFNVDPALTIPWTQKLNVTNDVPLKMMLGQWGHMSPDNRAQNQTPQIWTRYDWAEILLHWFDKYLKGLDVDTGPNVQVQDSTGQWRDQEAFPPKSPEWTTYHLSEGGTLSPESGTAGSVQLLPNPQGDTGCDSLRSAPCRSIDFGLAAPEGGLRFSGLPRLHITVNPQGPGGYLAAFLIDVDEHGTEKPVGWTTMNLMFADGTETQKPVVPGQDIVAKMEFQPLDDYFAPGHRMIVRIWEFQDHDRIPSVPPSIVTVKYGGGAKSVLELPIVHPDEAAFFNPPMPPEGWTPPTTQ